MTTEEKPDGYDLVLPFETEMGHQGEVVIPTLTFRQYLIGQALSGLAANPDALGRVSPIDLADEVISVMNEAPE